MSLSTGVAYKLRGFQENAEAWDAALRRFPNVTVFHSSAWLAMLAQTMSCEIVRLEVLNSGEVTGLFCGAIVRKGPFRILGSPLRGWGTPVMGPVFAGGFEAESFLSALSVYARSKGISIVEITSATLDASALERAGFRKTEDVTFAMSLGNQDDAWQAIQPRTRSYIRKAEKSGVTVERATTEEHVREFHDQVKEVFAKSLMLPPRRLERSLALWRQMNGRGLILFRAIHEQQCIASYLVAYDQATMWGLSSASRIDSLHLRANDLLHWTAISEACRLELRRFDFCGGGDYKKKYGGVLEPRCFWVLGINPVASAAFRFAERAWYLKREIVLTIAEKVRRQ